MENYYRLLDLKVGVPGTLSLHNMQCSKMCSTRYIGLKKPCVTFPQNINLFHVIKGNIFPWNMVLTVARPGFVRLVFERPLTSMKPKIYFRFRVSNTRVSVLLRRMHLILHFIYLSNYQFSKHFPDSDFEFVCFSLKFWSEWSQIVWQLPNPRKTEGEGQLLSKNVTILTVSRYK